MNEYIVKVLKTTYLTHNVKSFVVERPAVYNFIPGQATEISINTAQLKNELRAFTIVSDVEDEYLEFIIKCYTGHNGITERMLDTKPGDEWILHEVFGTLPFRGEGIFIAGGAGVTPFIAVFRHLHKQNSISRNILILANASKDDIICEDELTKHLGGNFINILESEAEKNKGEKYITAAQISRHIKESTAFYYLCGPPPFMKHCLKLLQQLNIPDEKIITES